MFFYSNPSFPIFLNPALLSECLKSKASFFSSPPQLNISFAQWHTWSSHVKNSESVLSVKHIVFSTVF